MSEATQRRIVVVGGGTAVWMTAAALGRFCEGMSITVVESDEIGTVGVGEATIPHIVTFNNALGIDEADFVAATGATYKLGIAFEGWGAPDEAYVHAFGQVGRGIGLLAFHHYWLRARASGFAKPFGHYLLNTIILAGDRFAHIERDPSDPLPPVPYAFHFDASLYARFLRKFAEEHGVVRQEGRIVAVNRHPTSGDISSVTLASGAQVEGDLFIDCSGFRGLLIEQELEAGFENWSHWLPCDRATAVPCASVSPVTPYTRAIARNAGWQWRIPLQHRIGNGHVYCSRHISEDEATATLLANLDGERTADPRTLRFSTGRRRKAWVRNVIAIGLSSGFIEPLESTSIHLIQTAVNRLLEMLPAGEIDASARDVYNERAAFEMERLRDFIVLHYHANGRVGEAFWDELRAMEIPETLKQRMELFHLRGWVQVMIGQNVMPERWHPLADQIEEAKLRRFLDMTEQAYVQEAAGLPDHGAYVARFAPMARPDVPAGASA
jgi:tryptophan 7-halogenase